MANQNELTLTGKVTAEGEVMLFKHRDGDFYKSSVRKVEWSNGDVEYWYYSAGLVGDWCDVPSQLAWKVRRALRPVEPYAV